MMKTGRTAIRVPRVGLLPDGGKVYCSSSYSGSEGVVRCEDSVYAL